MSDVKNCETLYEFDGPVVFVAELHGRDRLFVAFDEKGDTRRFLAAATDPQTVSAVREGRLSVLGALKAGDELHTIDFTSGMQAVIMVPVTLADMVDNLPKPNVGISHSFGKCPDKLPKTTAPNP